MMEKEKGRAQSRKGCGQSKRNLALLVSVVARKVTTDEMQWGTPRISRWAGRPVILEAPG